MNWKDATLRQLLETPIWQQPFAGLKILMTAVSIVLLVAFVVLLVEREKR